MPRPSDRMGLPIPIGTDIHNRENFAGLIEEIDAKTARKQDLDAHEALKNNPHEVTKSQVGLSNVENLALATEAEARAGIVTDKYMTPARTKQAIDALSTPPDPVTTTTNGLMTYQDKIKLSGIEAGAQVNMIIASQAEAEAGTNTTRAMTPIRTRNAITKQAMVVINHGTTASTARPTNAIAVYWIGTVEPSNALNNDLWIGG